MSSFTTRGLKFAKGQTLRILKRLHFERRRLFFANPSRFFFRQTAGNCFREDRSCVILIVDVIITVKVVVVIAAVAVAVHVVVVVVVVCSCFRHCSLRRRRRRHHRRRRRLL